MGQSIIDDVGAFSHSPAHLAIIRGDHGMLRRIVNGLPTLPKAGEVKSEKQSILAEKQADMVAAVLDRRDVPGRETPLHLAVRLGDASAADMLMSRGADWSLQNERGWSSLQEAVCSRQDAIAMIIVRHYQPLAWAKWCRRLPRIVGTMKRMPDFYMEVTFHFESSVIPFIARIAPSDTYRIWKRGSNMRADMTLAGFDGFWIQRCDQSFIFLGDGTEDGKLPPGSLYLLNHKEKEVMDALEGAGAPQSDADIAQEVANMSRTNVYRPGIDVTNAELVPNLNWRKQEKVEMVGPWKSKVYDMHHVVISVRSRRVPGAMTDAELFGGSDDDKDEDNDFDGETLKDLLAEDEAFKAQSLEVDDQTFAEARSSLSNGKLASKKRGSDSNNKLQRKDKEKVSRQSSSSSNNNTNNTEESEYKKGLRPSLWLTKDFPLKTEELIPLLDVLAGKVKAIRRLRELLTTKLPSGTFPVKMAIPVVPTIRVVVTFTKYQQLEPLDEFYTPLSSPSQFSDDTVHERQDSMPQQMPLPSSSSSWIPWISRNTQTETMAGHLEDHLSKEADVFAIPSDYTWIDMNEKKRRSKEKKGKRKKGKKVLAASNATTTV